MLAIFYSALMVLVPPRSEGVSSSTKGLLFVIFGADTASIAAYLVSDPLDIASTGFHIGGIAIFLTTYAMLVARGHDARSVWWFARTMPALIACNAATFGLWLHLSTDGAAASYPPAPLGGMVFPTLRSSLIGFSAPILALATVCTHRRRAFVHSCFAIPRPSGGRAPHGVTRLHVDSMCMTCSELLATHVLKPCGLGVCPSCFATLSAHVPRDILILQKNERKVRDALSRLKVTCPKCATRATHWNRIRHLDLDAGEKAV